MKRFSFQFLPSLFLLLAMFSTVAFFHVPTVLAQTAQPNLTITSFTIPNGAPGSIVSASVTLQNNGTSGVGAFEVGIHRNKPSGMTCALEVYTTTIASLAPGASQTVSIAVTLPPIATSYTASAMVDSDCVITESNETAADNTKQASYSVATIKPDLTAGTPFDPGAVSAGVNLAFMGPITSAVGAGNVTGSFNNRFQLDLGNSGTYDLDLDALTSITGLHTYVAGGFRVHNLKD